MIKIDSLKFEIQKNCINKLITKQFAKTLNQQPNQETITKCLNLPKAYKKLGLKDITILDDKLVFEVSAKILKENYLNGINKNNIEQVFNEINKTKLIDINTSKALDTAITHKVDITNNIYLEKPLKNYIIAISELQPIKQSFDFKICGKRNYESVVINSNNQTRKFKTRLTAYQKELELRKKEDNKELLYLLEKHNKLANIHRNLRIEQNLKNKYQARKQLNIKDNNLKSILLSSKNVNYNFLKDKIFTTKQSIQEISKEHLRKYKDFSKIVFYGGMENIINICYSDIELIRIYLNEVIQGTNPHNKKMQVYRYIGKFKKILNEDQATNNPTQNIYFDDILKGLEQDFLYT